MKVKVRCGKFKCHEDIHFETQPGPVVKNATSRPLAGNWTRALWISRPSLYQLSYRSRCCHSFSPGWVLKCVSLRHSNLLHLTLTFIYWQRVSMPNISINIPLYFTGITTHIYIYIYTELVPKLLAMASVTQLVEHWSRDPEGTVLIPSWIIIIIISIYIYIFI